MNKNLKRIIIVCTAIIVLVATFFAGAYYTIKTARIGYDDGFYLMESFGQIWVYPDGEYWDEYPERFTLCDWNESI